MSRNLILGTLKGTSSVPTDANFKNVTALLHGSGTNGSQNKTFSATGPSGATLTLSTSGSPSEGSFTPYGSTWSTNLPSSATSYLTYGASLSAGPANVTFTIECWALFQTLPTTQGPNGIYCFWQKGRTGTSNFELAFGLILDASGTGGYQISYQVSGNGTTVTNVNSPNLAGLTTGVWHHFAITQVANSGIVNYWFDGTNVGSSNHGVTNMYVGTAAAAIGNNNAGTNPQFSGNISNLRVVFGSQVYTSAFTPPTSPLTAITGTNFLGCQSNRFLDTSSNAWTVTPNGSASIQRFNPFGANGSVYSSSVYGGSVWLDGSSYLDTAANGNYQLTGDFTIECWAYQFSLGGNRYVAYWTPGTATACAFMLNINPSGFVNFAYGIGGTNGNITGTTAKANINSWNHVAVSRQGTTFRMFVNGVMDATTATLSGSLNTTSGAPLYIGADNTGSGGAAANLVNGYLSDVRIVNGTALYTASFSPPTSPLSAVTNTVFLYKAQSAGTSGVYDSAMQQDFRTVGTAQISTAQAKFSGSSWFFNATLSGGVYPCLSFPGSGFQLGLLNFTIEAWIYPTSSGQSAQLMGPAKNGTNSDWLFYLNAGKLAFHWNNSSDLTSTTSPAINTWSHVAAVRSGNTLTLYVNGVSAATTTMSGSVGVNTGDLFTIGADGTLASMPYAGYMCEIRLTFGIARYTASFTPPTAAFPNK